MDYIGGVLAILVIWCWFNPDSVANWYKEFKKEIDE